MKKIVILAAKQKPILCGHPWVFPKAINQQDAKIQSGELLKVFSSDEKLIGYGVYNAHSLYRVRMLSYVHESLKPELLEDIIEYRLKMAKSLRVQLGLPNAKTNAYRVFNSEGDGLSGLVIDVYADICVVSSSAYWVEQQREVITSLIKQLFSPKSVLWFSQSKPLHQDGWDEKSAEVNETVSMIVLENGIQFSIDFSQTQKTGLFLDQRENHQLIANFCKNKSVLDFYCFTGAFALHAAAAGAKNVTAVDSSAPAISQAKRNVDLNALKSVEFIEGDARDHLSLAKDYDVVIVDPPKIVPSMRHLAKGENYYKQLHGELFKVMKPNSLLFTCNCSSAMSAENFMRIVDLSAIQADRRLRVLGSYGSASDHPSLGHFPEGNYLHTILLAVQ